MNKLEERETHTFRVASFISIWVGRSGLYGISSGGMGDEESTRSPSVPPPLLVVPPISRRSGDESEIITARSRQEILLFSSKPSKKEKMLKEAHKRPNSRGTPSTKRANRSKIEDSIDGRPDACTRTRNFS